MTLTELKESNPALMVYFTSPGCQVCAGLKPKVREMAATRFPGIKYVEVDVSVDSEMASEAGVFSAPTIIVWFEGREYVREGRMVSVSLLIDKISRYYDMIF